MLALHSTALSEHNGVYIQFSALTHQIELVNLTKNRKERVENPTHPAAAALDALGTKTLWQFTSQLLKADFENQAFTVSQALAIS